MAEAYEELRPCDYASNAQKEIAKQLKVVYPIIQEILQERKHNWIFDYTDAFSLDEYIYIGSVHTSPNGNRIIAERLFEDISKEENVE